LFPEQCFNENGEINPELAARNVIVGQNAFVLYRTHESLRNFPIPNNWQIRTLEKDGQPIERRGMDVIDIGHYVLRISALSPDPAREEGPPQGIFAPEYANAETNFLSQLLLVWLIVKTDDSPYANQDLTHIESILSDHGLLDIDSMEKNGVISNGITSCPLCKKTIQYNQLHNMLEMEDENRLANAGQQVFGATRSTEVNLFHITPLLYTQLEHIPTNLGWGHASCNTKLGQMECTSIDELESEGNEVTVNGETLGWASEDSQIIRSSSGKTWIKISEGNE
jgi:hypothetical protein